MAKYRFYSTSDAARVTRLPKSTFYDQPKDNYKNALLRHYPCLTVVSDRKPFYSKQHFPKRRKADNWSHENVWTALHMRAVLHADHATIKQHTGFTENEVDLLIRASRELAEDPIVGRVFRPTSYSVKSKDPLTGRPITLKKTVAIPSRPRVKVDQKFARKVERKINALPPRRQNQIASIYLREVHQNREWFDFQDGVSARQFLKLCMDLKVGKRFLWRELLPSAGDKNQLLKQKQYWKEELKPFYMQGVKALTLEVPTSRGRYGTLRMRWHIEGQEETTPGIRFAMLTYLIINRYRSTESKKLLKTAKQGSQ